jgi:hypothetical protein
MATKIIIRMSRIRSAGREAKTISLKFACAPFVAGLPKAKLKKHRFKKQCHCKDDWETKIQNCGEDILTLSLSLSLSLSILITRCDA